jgi:hypothetical protein
MPKGEDLRSIRSYVAESLKSMEECLVPVITLRPVSARVDAEVVCLTFQD